MNAAAKGALAYLPANATVRAVIFPEIKPRTNTFVFTTDSVPGIFLYVDPARTAAQEENTLAHEMHHLGYSSACPVRPDSSLGPVVDMLRMRLFGFGEGLAMLAAAGSATTHPHAVSDAATRARWDRDVANVGNDMKVLERWMADVLDGRVTSADSVQATAMTFYGTQGPWYTVGWYMASTIERAFGRSRLIAAMCDPVGLMTTYNAAASASQPEWTAAILRRLPRSR